MKPFPPPLLLSHLHCFCRVLVQIGAVQAVARESYFMAIEGNQTLLLLVNMIFSYLALFLSFFFWSFYCDVLR